jgi:hypothetical protein
MTRNDELVTSKFEVGDGGFSNGLNVVIENNGTITKRKGYNTFGEMVDVLWNINKKLKKFNSKIVYTIMLPLKGTKPVYKKTLVKDK